ncbi:MAG: hypothetical protein ACXQTL_00605, partial [Methanosarcinales archaeon]
MNTLSKTDPNRNEEGPEVSIERHASAETVHDLVNLFCTSHDDWRPIDTMQVYRGSVPNIDILWRALPPSYQQR